MHLGSRSSLECCRICRSENKLGPLKPSRLFPSMQDSQCTGYRESNGLVKPHLNRIDCGTTVQPPNLFVNFMACKFVDVCAGKSLCMILAGLWFPFGTVSIAQVARHLSPNSVIQSCFGATSPAILANSRIDVLLLILPG